MFEGLRGIAGIEERLGEVEVRDGILRFGGYGFFENREGFGGLL